MNTRAFVVGTAGHVDHGKSTLVQRLTGIDPDRLQEEKERELTIDLGFAWLTLPNGQSISVVDVPGHERFIKNMLAGVGGIDAAILVVAADDGPMPQTREHLAILDLLEISTGVVVLSKRDLVDPDWLELVEAETRDTLQGTLLENAPIVPVSSTTGEGMEDLLPALEAILTDVDLNGRRGRARLPVDRVFAVSGFGTVVTGTLSGEALEVGQEVELLPSGVRGRVRGLQTHGDAVDRAIPGSRVAVNVSGVDRDEVQRGDLLAVPDWVVPTKMLDARLRLTPAAPRALEQNDPVDFFVGSSERAAHVTLLESETIQPGESSWVQIRFEDAVPVVDGDLFIVRQASPSMTIGGGRVVNAHPRRHRRFRPDVISELEARLRGRPSDLIAQEVSEGPATLSLLLRDIGLEQQTAVDAAVEAVEAGQIVHLGAAPETDMTVDSVLMDARAFETVADDIRRQVARYHAQNPLRRGMPREEVRSRTGLPGRLFDALARTLADREIVRDDGDVIASPNFEIRLSDDQQANVTRFLTALDESDFSPPSPDEFGVDRDLIAVIESRGDVVQVDAGIVYSTATFEKMRNGTLAAIDRDGSITLAGFRDLFSTSRKYAQAVLESFDDRRITRRSGDERVRGSG
ncbi:MAG: selenocysteine-specific translation elongation factor [Thermomicrobiales bacterium]